MWTSVISLAVGAIVTYQAGFNWIGSWETGEQAAHKLAVSACVQQFLLQPDRSVIYATLMETSSAFQRGRLLQEHELAPGSAIAKDCGDKIGTLDAAMFPAA